MSTLRFWKAVVVMLALCFGAMTAAHAAGHTHTRGPVKVVYQISEGEEQAARALVRIRNHLAADPGTKIVVVALGAGVRFLLDGEKDKNGNPFEVAVQTLQQQGVEFRACNNSLIGLGISKDKVIPEASVVDSGLAEVARLQYREGYAYVIP